MSTATIEPKTTTKPKFLKLKLWFRITNTYDNACACCGCENIRVAGEFMHSPRGHEESDRAALGAYCLTCVASNPEARILKLACAEAVEHHEWSQANDPVGADHWVHMRALLTAGKCKFNVPQTAHGMALSIDAALKRAEAANVL